MNGGENRHKKQSATSSFGQKHEFISRLKETDRLIEEWVNYFINQLENSYQNQPGQHE
jgi:hypothetical protein